MRGKVRLGTARRVQNTPPAEPANPYTPSRHLASYSQLPPTDSKRPKQRFSAACYSAYGNELIARFLHAFLLKNRLVPAKRAAAKPEQR